MLCQQATAQIPPHLCIRHVACGKCIAIGGLVEIAVRTLETGDEQDLAVHQIIARAQPVAIGKDRQCGTFGQLFHQPVQPAFRDERRHGNGGILLPQVQQGVVCRIHHFGTGNLFIADDRDAFTTRNTAEGRRVAHIGDGEGEPDKHDKGERDRNAELRFEEIAKHLHGKKGFRRGDAARWPQQERAQYRPCGSAATGRPVF